GDRRLHRPADREPGGAQAEGGGDRPHRLPGARAMRIIRGERDPSPASPRPVEQVAGIGEAGRRGGDAALLNYTERYDGARLTADRIRVEPDSLTAALTGLDGAV